MSDIDFDFCYKGGRDYIHGTDIFDRCLDFLSKSQITPETIDMSIHSLIKNQLTLVPPLDEMNHKSSVNVTYKVGQLSKAIHLWETSRRVNCRRAYDENDIIDKSVLDVHGRSILIGRMGQFSFVEKAVALNKTLLLSIFKNTRGKWYFTRIRLSDLTFISEESNSEMAIELKRNLGYSLTDSLIFVGDKNVGNIYFSMV